MKILIQIIFMLYPVLAVAQWLNLSEVAINQADTEQGGAVISISYRIEEHLSEDNPGYIFVRTSMDQGKNWHLVDGSYLRGNGAGIVSSPGKKTILIWGGNETGIIQSDIRINGIWMAKVPSGAFKMRSFPAGGKDPSISSRPDTVLPDYYMMINEVTIGMYADYLNETSKDTGAGWNEKMANTTRCGILRHGIEGQYSYEVAPGREKYPVTYVSWYDANAFLFWCGLALPTEIMFEKAYAGGIYLDGDASSSLPNPNPERKFPWGDEMPDQNGIYRCNFNGSADGFATLAPVGSFDEFQSPYGINDLAGNVTEWTLDWYTTPYHTGLDGFRMVRGGSWLADPIGCDAISGATQFPVKESSIMGFRGVLVK